MLPLPDNPTKKGKCMEWLTRILTTDAGATGLILRLTLGVMILPHGLQKTIGAFGGYGFNGTMDFFTKQMGIPWLFALAAILAESVGGAALLFGAGTRLAAAVVGVTMVVAAVTSHLQNGFFMNWFGQQKGEGIEFHLLAVGIALTLVLVGGGLASIDALLTGKQQ